MERRQMNQVKTLLFRLRAELGPVGMAAICMLAAAAVFFALVLQPLEERSNAAQARIPVSSQQSAPNGQKVQSVYQYLRKPEETTDWLAKLYAIGSATGVSLSSATYRTQSAAAGPLERTEIVLPLTGSYGQMRDFLKRSLAEIPVMSLDQVSLKRDNRRDGTLQAEVRLTLHRVKS
jgi:Tfp pilus assembly protein PilO